ncbi:MAG: hypothetical protein IJ666_00700 [Ruminococcus sp.]|nr:hypothetical protein [Ruminococcus sp.]
MNEIKKALAVADENSIIELANKGIYKRACKDIDGVKPEFTENADNISVSLGGETVEVKAPLTECKCSCVSRTVCRHIIGAILLLKDAFRDEKPPEEDKNSPENPEEIKAPEAHKAKEDNKKSEKKKDDELSEKDIAKINACARQCLNTLGDIIKRGLVRIPETAPENLEIAAVQCHSLRMADAERALRELGGRLSDCIERRASFSIKLFSEKFCKCVKMLTNLCRDDITSGELGTFRRKYETYKGNLTILPIGQRSVAGGEYEGEIYYFLNTDENAEKRFLSVSDLRPVFYENANKYFSRFTPKILPWGMGNTLSSMMHSKMVLGNAKISGGNISTSQETQLLMHTKANMDCDEVKNIICTDFRKIIIDIAEKDPQNETDSLFFVQPAKCISADFDRYSQTYNMIIEDFGGRRAAVSAKYRAETKKFIEILEKTGKSMTEKSDRDYVILASAYIDNGSLKLFPIDIYDFIDVYAPQEYNLPDEYAELEKNIPYCSVILNLLDEIQDRLEITLQCGLQSDLKNNHKLESLAFNYGLKGLSILTAGFMSSAEVYRHGMDNVTEDILRDMCSLDEYIKLTRKKLKIMSALFTC